MCKPGTTNIEQITCKLTPHGLIKRYSLLVVTKRRVQRKVLY